MLPGRDNRAVSTLIGVVLLFGVFVILLSVYQAQLVPSQNKQVEFNHFQTVENEMTQFRADVLNAKRNGEERSATVTLGTRYPSRLIGVNPPDPSGSLRTTNQGEVEFSGLGGYAATTLCSGGEASTVESASVVYDSGYHELRDVESVSYENTFTARSFREAALFGPQDLVETDSDGNVQTLDLVILTGDYSETRVDTVTIDINATESNETTRDPSNDQFTLTVPSQFSPDEWENEVLSGVSVTATENTAGDADRVDLTFDTTDEVSLKCAAVGVGEQSPTVAYDPLAGVVAGEDQINPAAPGDVKLDDATTESGQGVVSMDFSNLANTDTQVVQARIPFYSGQGGSIPDFGFFSANENSDRQRLDVQGDFEDLTGLTTPIVVDADGTTTLWLDFNSPVGQNDWFIITLVFENGERGQYFVTLENN